MIYLSFQGVIVSVLGAMLYGFLFGCAYHIIGKIPVIFKVLLGIPKESLFYSGSVFSREKCISNKFKSENKFINGSYLILSVFLFSIGYLLLSYVTHDGEIRIYILLLSLFGFLASFCIKVLLNLAVDCFFRLLFIAVLFLRTSLFPIHIILMALNKRYKLLLSKVEKKLPLVKK